MRPFALDPLFRNIASLQGVGPRYGKILERLTGGVRIIDLLWHKPLDGYTRQKVTDLARAADDQNVIISFHVKKHKAPKTRGLPLRVEGEVGGIPLDLVFFNAHGDYVQQSLPIDQVRYVAGRIETYKGHKQIVHPDYIVTNENEIPAFECIYPLTEGLSNKVLRKMMAQALEILPSLPEWLDEHLLKREKWPAWLPALKTLHTPTSADEIAPQSITRRRLAYDELLANQIMLALVRRRQKKRQGKSFETNSTHKQNLYKVLPFTLTGAQLRVIKEIDADMSSGDRMVRLLQGDVGSGKTIVAALAMMNAVDSGKQAALMAPTEILARQHAETLKPFFEKLGINFVTLTGRDKGKAREEITNAIESGSAQIIIGTHALFQEKVKFHDLGLAVIDEQHRFGVQQRLLLGAKGDAPDMLVMTATPIPRTLTLTLYGDMEVSRLDEKPPGRRPIDTRLLPHEKMPELLEGLGRSLQEGNRIYWVCPLIEESEMLDIAAAEERFRELQQRFGNKVGLLHGRMKGDEKENIMHRFMQGEITVLVSTTVIEVGVNVPEATIMVIDHAERFGLAQLHQLRGRVGRGLKESFCFLLYGHPVSEFAKERLRLMRETEDGFLIAEKDLKLRGGGDILGTRQSGLPDFHLADLAIHDDLLPVARDDAKLLLEKDPSLQSPRGQALRNLLYLFGLEESLNNMEAG